jgi:hypothetical protein
MLTNKIQERHGTGSKYKVPGESRFCSFLGFTMLIEEKYGTIH